MVNVTQTDVSVERDAKTKPAPSIHLERGAAVGRYVILDVVGEGGMGIVYAAYDPELDRKLALKLLRTASSERRAERRRLRLIREAQAMARLSHAHVITVHDVGTIDDQVFVAMEFIEGCSLAEWIRMDHDWRRVVDVFVQAGEGLAAAHAAGLVHRDFKPDNVMLTAEHRAVVTDFGLARAAGRREGSNSRDPEGLGGPSRASLSTTVTAAGAIMGTPAYMSAEQHEGGEVDARSDQFAFAVALYEALYGVRPFPGDDVASLAYNVGAGNVRPAPARSSIPSWIRQVLLRALSVEPADRYPSMVELLEALRRDRPGRRRWPYAVGAAVLVLGGLGAAQGFLFGETDDPCVGALDRLEAATGPLARAPVERAFSEAAAPFGAESLASVESMLMQYRGAWLQTHDAVCAAAEPKAGAIFHRRMECMDRRLMDVSAQLEVLAEPDDVSLEHALEAVSALPSPQRCRNASARADTAPELYAQLATVAALARAGRTVAGLQAARALLERAATSQDEALQAQTHLWSAALQRDVGRLELAEFDYREALGFGLRGGTDAVAAEAAVALVDIIGADPTRTQEAEGWIGVADALLARSDASREERAALLLARAQLLERSGRVDAARRPLREAAEGLEEAYGPRDIRVAAVWVHLGQHALRSSELVTARASLERALSVFEAAFGAQHPRCAAVMRDLGEVAMLEGDLERAAEHLGAGLEIARLYSDPGLRGELMLLHASVETARGDLEAAEEALVVVAASRHLPPALAERAAVGLARLALRRGELDVALREVEAAGVVDDGGVGALDAIRADALMRRGRVTEAAVRLDETIEVLEQREGDTAPGLAEPLTIRGELLLSRMLPARALGDLERALALRSGRDAYGLARTEFALARALAAVDPSSQRALELAREALGRLNAGEPLHEDVQRWLSGR